MMQIHAERHIGKPWFRKDCASLFDSDVNPGSYWEPEGTGL